MNLLTYLPLVSWPLLAAGVVLAVAQYGPPIVRQIQTGFTRPQTADGSNEAALVAVLEAYDLCRQAGVKAALEPLLAAARAALEQRGGADAKPQ